MKRREFILSSTRGVALLAAGGLLQSHRSDDPIPSPADIITRFAIASDGHYGQRNTPYDQFHDEMMGWLNAEHARSPLAFVMFNGDLIHDDPVYLPAVRKKYEKLQVPFYASRGNHDRCSADLWKSTFGYGLNYSFSRGRNAFIVLDTSDEKGSYLCPDPEWLRKQLIRFRKSDHIFVFMHITPFKWTENGVDCRTLTDLLGATKNLTAIFHGHDHDQDAVKFAGEKPYFFDGHLGGSWGTDYRGYRIVEILKSGRVRTYQVNPAASEPVNTWNG